MTPTRLFPRQLLGALALVVAFVIGAPRARAQDLMVYDFELSGTPAQNADHVRGLGFKGIVTRCNNPADLPKLAAYVNHAATLQDFQVLAYVNYDFDNPNSAQVWPQALPLLASAGAPLWVIVKNAPTPQDVNQLLRRMAKRSRLAGVRTVLYPHWDTDIENAAEAAAVIAQVGHPNLSNSLHTCHEIRSGNGGTISSVVNAHAAGSRLVTIAGADVDAYAGPPTGNPVPWSDAIKPLDQGTYDLIPYLQALEDSGYDGPVILQTFGITNDPGHLSRSIERYARLRAMLI